MSAPGVSGDIGDLTTGVGSTATLVATARAVAHRSGLINDPFAEALVTSVGLEFFTKVATGELALSDLGDGDGMALLTDLFAVRTKYFDNFVTDACRSGIRQVVILASGLDARPYRLWWPAGTTVYEIDQPRVIDAKTRTLRSLNAAPTAHRRAVGIDLRHDWPQALRRVGFDATEPSVWIVEGLLIGLLPPVVEERLLDSVTALSAPGSRFAGDYVPHQQPPLVSQEHALAKHWAQFGYRSGGAGLVFSDEHHDVADSLTTLGWRITLCDLEDLFSATGLPGLRRQDLKGAPVAGRYVQAVLA